ncbi:hypothetical protein K5549_005976 [Capra hircus]|nr:hypothetical protein K5549_005976 [Capra hircus]
MELGIADEKLKEGVKTKKNNHTNLKVERQDGSEVPFNIKRHTPLSTLIKPISEKDTPEQLEVEDEDTTVVFQQQIVDKIPSTILNSHGNMEK